MAGENRAGKRTGHCATRALECTTELMLPTFPGFLKKVLDASAGAPDAEFRRRKIGQIYLYRINFIGGFYGSSEIFLTHRKTTV